MALAAFPEQQDTIDLLQRSLRADRLGHAYLFQGNDIAELEAVSRNLAKTLNCLNPPARSPGGRAVDCCDACANCRQIEKSTHPDVLWIRPESKSRIVTIDQMRELMQTINLKPTSAPYKVAIIVGADRLNVQAANAFLKTLEEPPINSVLILLTTDRQRVLETIISRCLRLNFAGESSRFQDPAFSGWLGQFTEVAAAGERSVLGRYRLLSLLLTKLAALREQATGQLTERSPLEQYDDIDPKLRDRWEDELAAAIEAEYRRLRSDLLAGVHWWLRDLWFQTLSLTSDLFTFPKLAPALARIGTRLTSAEAMENIEALEQTQRLLNSNVQEALALEVGLLKLKL